MLEDKWILVGDKEQMERISDILKTVDGRKTNSRCTWTYWWDYWETYCGKQFSLNSNTPEENGMVFCPYCGREITAKYF